MRGDGHGVCRGPVRRRSAWPPARTCALLGALGLLVSLAIAPASRADLTGRTAPDWVLKDLGGIVHRSEEWRGGWVLLKLGRTVCPDCARESVELEKARPSLERLGVGVLDIFLYEDRRTVKAYLEKAGRGDWPTVLYDWTPDTARDYRISIIPHLVLVDPAGAVAWESGYLEAPELAHRVERYVGGALAGETGRKSE